MESRDILRANRARGEAEQEDRVHIWEKRQRLSRGISLEMRKRENDIRSQR